MKKKKWDKDVVEAVTMILVYVAFAVAGFFAGAGLFVLGWDWTAVPLFGAHPAGYLSGLGVMLLIGVAKGLFEGLKDRK